MADLYAGVHLQAPSTSGVLFTDRRDFYIEPNEVAELYPSVGPFYTFVSKCRTRTTGKDPEFKMFEHRASWVDTDFFIGAAVDWNTGSYEGTVASLAIELTAAGGDAVPFIQRGDVVEVRAQASPAARPLGTAATATTDVVEDQILARLLVTAIVTSTTSGVTAIKVENLSAAGGDTYNLADGDKARIITNAMPEGSDSNDGWMSELETVWGLAQIIKTPYKLTGSLANAKLRGYDNQRAFMRDQKFKEHKSKLNGMYLRGYMGGASTSARTTQATQITDPTSTSESYGNAWRTSWGAIPLLETYGTADEQVFERYWGNYDLAAFIDDMRARSKYFNEEFEEYAFAGPKVIAEFSKTGSASFFERSGGAISLSEWRMSELGFKVRTLQHPFGRTHIAWDPSMRYAPYDNMLLIVDPENIERRIYRQSKFEAAIQDNDVDGIKDQFFSDEGLGMTLIEKHALFKFA